MLNQSRFDASGMGEEITTLSSSTVLCPPSPTPFVTVYMAAIVSLQQKMNKHLRDADMLTDRETVRSDFVWAEEAEHLFLFVQRGADWKGEI